MPSQHTVIVGGSSGIGLTTARHLLSSGGQVTITGRNESRMADAKRQLGPATKTVIMDATDFRPSSSRSAHLTTWCLHQAAAAASAPSPP